MCLFYTCWYFEIGKHITCWNNQLRWALQQSPLSLLHLLELLKSGVSDEWPLLLQRTTDLFRTTVSLPLCGHFPVNCCVILPDFLPTMPIRSPPHSPSRLPSDPLCLTDEDLAALLRRNSQKKVSDVWFMIVVSSIFGKMWWGKTRQKEKKALCLLPSNCLIQLLGSG